jgi:hypothetical protein
MTPSLGRRRVLLTATTVPILTGLLEHPSFADDPLLVGFNAVFYIGDGSGSGGNYDDKERQDSVKITLTGPNGINLSTEYAGSTTDQSKYWPNNIHWGHDLQININQNLSVLKQCTLTVSSYPCLNGDFGSWAGDIIIQAWIGSGAVVYKKTGWVSFSDDTQSPPPVQFALG